MRNVCLLVAIISLAFLSAKAQDIDTLRRISKNNMEFGHPTSQSDKVIVGGYGEVHFNQDISSKVLNNGKLDVHRLVMLFGYQFNSKVKFITEVEFEHVKELYVEQAFLQYKLSPLLNFKGGLILIPMGIINEYHEPPTFNGVERPLIDKYISPSTWREVGIGIHGNYLPGSLKYQAYLVNGFNGFDGAARLDGKNGLRKGRQKGAESYISSPNLAVKVEYYGLRSLNMGISAYFGKTQSSLYNGIDRRDEKLKSRADSSVVGIDMVGLDSRYQYKAWQIKTQFYYTRLSNAANYNEFVKSETGNENDLGKAFLGYYVEAAYNILKNQSRLKSILLLFVRYENINTHFKVDEKITKNKAYHKQSVITGISWKPARGAVVKMELQFIKSAAQNKFSTIFNAGFGVFF